MTARFVVFTKMFNEAEFLPTFIRYYLEQGAESIVLYDDESSDDSVRIAKQTSSQVTVRRFSRKFATYDRESDEHRCQELFQDAIQSTFNPRWCLFPDVDELIRPPQGCPQRLTDGLEELSGIDGVPCAGLHCLPRFPEDQRFELLPEELIPILDQVSPPRSIERSHRQGASWKVPIWFMGPDAGQRFEGLRLSSGSHMLLGRTAHLVYSQPAWLIYHYKVRRVSSYLKHVGQVYDKVPENSHYKEIWGPSYETVANWGANRFRILKLAPVLGQEEIWKVCRETGPPGVYEDSPFRPGVWGHE